MDDQFLTKVEALAAAGHANELDFRSVVARVATDQFLSVTEAGEADVARYVACMLDALDKVDEATASRVAEALAPSGRAPRAVLARLIEKGPTPASVVLKLAPDLPHALLLARAEIGDGREAAVIAARSDIDRTIIAALARRLEPETLRALAANTAIALDHGALVALAQRGRVDLELGRALIARAEPGVSIEPLFLAADAPTRRRIMRDAQLGSLAVGDSQRTPLEMAREAALIAARAGDARAFCTIVATALRVSRADIARLVDDAEGEPLGLLFAAIGFVAAESGTPILALRPDLASNIALSTSGARLAMSVRAAAARHVLSSVLRAPATAAPSGEFFIRPRAVAAPSRDNAAAPSSEAAINRG